MKKINDYLWQLEKEGNMNVPVSVYANSAIMENMKRDRTLKQASNAACLPNIVKSMLVMPDGHEGYGFPIGGVAAFDANDGILSPGSIGFDIGCGVRLIKTNITAQELKPKLNALMDAMFRNVPSGVGSKMQLGFTQKQLEKSFLPSICCSMWTSSCITSRYTHLLSAVFM